MLILIGPSASGKTEVAKILEKNYHLKKLITHTTRPMRKSEVMDVDYHFVSSEHFLAMKENDEFVETTCYNHNYYGTSKAEIADQKCVILDPNGVEAFYKLKDPRIYIVFLKCSKAIREERMKQRGDLPHIINERLESDDKTFCIDIEKFANKTISSEVSSPEELAETIYNLYQEHLLSIK